MIISAVLAVALGLMPVRETNEPQVVNFDEARLAAQLGTYRRSIRNDGSIEVSGCDRSGRAYRLTISSSGHVTGEVGDWDVTFDFKTAA